MNWKEKISHVKAKVAFAFLVSFSSVPVAFADINETALWESVDILWVILPVIVVMLVFGLIIKMLRGGIR